MVSLTLLHIRPDFSNYFVILYFGVIVEKTQGSTMGCCGRHHIYSNIFFHMVIFNHYYYQSLVFPHVYLYQSGMYLSFPTSLMIYVAMRFKEILTEVQVNAQQVVQLSEEKKEQAVKQQKILEEEVTRQTIELRTSLENLKSTQAQLIQSEKMASLGELTAGIAHEIQNPLNFVNNFSEVNKELIEELKDEIEKGKYGMKQ